MPLFFSDAKRRRALQELAILDTDAEPAFDQLTALASDLFDAPIALISLIDDDRQWFKASVGLEVRSTPRDVSFCDHAIRGGQAMVVPDATLDTRFFMNPLVTGAPHVRFYAGVPLHYNDALIGTLCIISPKVRYDFDTVQLGRLQKLADSISATLILRQEAMANKAAIRKLQETQRKLELMEEVAGVGYWHIDLRANEAFWSRGVYAIHGLNRESYRPQIATAIDLFHPDDRAELSRCIADSAATGGEFTFKLRLMRADGEERIVFAKGGAEMGEDGKPEFLFGTLEDVTESSQIENTLRAASETAEAHQQAKSDFLSNMSHEIRTPLTTMIGYSNLLTGVKDLPKDAQHYIGRINKAGKALLALVNDVLDFSKLEAGQVTLDPQATQMKTLASDVVEEFHVLAQSKGFDIEFDYDAASPVWLMIDDVRIRQVLYNLVGNACKFTRQGHVNVAATAAGGRLRVEVRDSGPGLTEDQQVQLFKRFNQVDNSINRKYGGSGLGLSICYEIVQLMQGRIGVTSEIGHGSCFWFDIPVSEAEAPAVVAPAEYLQPVFLEDRRVLIVDDHPINRELIRLLLKDYGLEIYEACDGSEAVDLCMRMKFDLMFMDIQMPVLDGIAATRAIREQCPLNARTAIVALSARNQTKLSEDIRGQGFTHALSKPIDMPQFYATLHRCLEGDPEAERYAG